MAKVNVRFDHKASAEKILKAFSRVRENKAMQQEIGNFLVDRVKAEARRGKPLNSSRSFPALRPSTISNRKQLAKFNSTDGTFKPSRSNLTITGQLLNGIKFRLKGSAIVELFISGKRKPYKISANRSARKNNVNSRNETLDKVLRKKGFRAFTAQGINSEPKIAKRVNNIVKKVLRRALGVTKRLDKL